MREQPGGEIILYQRGDATTIDVRLIGDTVWLSLNQIADLLGRDKSTISRHIANVFAEGELERNSVVAEFATTAADSTSQNCLPRWKRPIWRPSKRCRKKSPGRKSHEPD